MNRKWTYDEVEFLRKNRNKLTAKQIGERLGRLKRSVYYKAHQLGILLRKGKWKKNEIKFLLENYEKMSINDIERKLKRTRWSIFHKAYRLGLKRRDKTWKSEIDFVKEYKDAIVDYKNILNTYEGEQKKNGYNYINAKKLRKTGKRLEEIADELKVSLHTLKGWCFKTKPLSIHSVEKLARWKLLPLIVDDNTRFMIFLKLFAWIFGDGHISNELRSIVLAGDYSTLESFQKEIENVFPSLNCKLRTSKTRGEFQGRVIKGESSYLIIDNTALARLLHAAGAPKGDKIIQPLKLPDWIFKMNKEFKSIFLGILWSSDGTKPMWSKNWFYLCLQLSKSLKFKEEHEIFMNGIRNLFTELGIETSPVRWGRNSYIRKKDDELVDKAYFYVSTKLENFLKFYKDVPIICKEKRMEFEKTFLVVKDKMEKRKKRSHLFLEAKKLFKNGESIRQISEKLEIPYSTVKVWVRGLHKPIGT